MAKERGSNHSRETVLTAIEVSAASAVLFAVAYRLLRNREDAEDAVQNAYEKALRASERFRGQSEPSTWLHRVTINAAKDLIDYRKRRPAEEFQEQVHQRADPDMAVDPERQLLIKESDENVRELLEQLPEAQRKALVLSLLEIPYDEVMELTEMPVGTTKAYVHRGKKTLRQILEDGLKE